MSGFPTLPELLLSLIITALWWVFFDWVIACRPARFPPRLWAIACLLVIYVIPLYLMLA